MPALPWGCPAFGLRGPGPLNYSLDRLMILLIGFQDPNVLLPSCGCVLHASSDITFFAPPASIFLMMFVRGNFLGVRVLSICAAIVGLFPC